MAGKEGHCCPSQGPAAAAKSWYRRPSFGLAVALGVVLAASVAVPLLVPFRDSFVMYFRMVWLAFLTGIVLGGIIDRFVPREYITVFLARPKKRTILYSVLIGFLMSACSHGILALAIELHKKGASNAAVVAFLLASPWANLPLTLMLLGFFGPKALFFILGAIGIAITTGLIFQVFERCGWIEKNPNALTVEHGFSVTRDLHRRATSFRLTGKRFADDLRSIGRGMVSLLDMVLWWVLLGMVLAAAAGAYIPEHVFHGWMGPSLGGMLATLLLATVLEVCSEGTSPLAFEIYRQTGAFGNAFVFLMAGVVTDISEIGLVWSNLGKRTAVLIPVVSVPQVLILGYIANRIF